MVMDDVVESILSRCTARDLLRFKMVCKPWYSMISSDYFPKAHANLISNNKDESNTNRKIAMFSEFPGSSRKQALIPLGWSYYRQWSLGGSSRGLVCLHLRSKHRIFVTNPVTRQWRELQLPPMRNPRDLRCLGFGYDPSSDDYKVVFAVCQEGGDHSVVRILSLKSDTWKDSGQVNYRFDDGSLAKPGILVNGALHWFWFDPTKQNIFLVSFDLAKEEFNEIPQPDDTKYVWNFEYNLGTIQGLLCIFRSVKGKAVGIWVMQRYNSWELFPEDREIEEHTIHYMVKDTNKFRMMPPQTYYCDDTIHLSRSEEHISCPMFVQTLVWPYAAGSLQEN